MSQEKLDNPDDFEVVWSGRDPLLPPRNTKPDIAWEPPRRLYNREKTPVVTIGERSATPSQSVVEETKE